MNKSIILLLLAFPFLAFSQTEENIKPQGGDKTLEFQFTPFGDNPITINGIRARWFSSEKKAFRLNTFLGVDSDRSIIQQEDPDQDLEELTYTSSIYTINLRPGFEKHIEGTKKLSPYFGMEFDLAYQTAIRRVEEQFGSGVRYTKYLNESDGYARFGVNLIAGFDYYISNKFYLGTEMGFGASYYQLLSYKVKSDINGFVEPEPLKRGGSIDIGPNVNTAIRLGYAF